MQSSVDTFSQLSKLILELAATHFVHLPVPPQPELLSQIPSTLPSILGDTLSAQHLRASYIAHIVSTILTSRVFTPFLFCIGRRFDKADDLFTNISHQLRAKSTRKEAIWRQHTLIAAYTTTDAKQRINSAAGAVVEEIVSELLPFTEPNAEESIRVAVRRIVKLAAEAWRYARLEREIIEVIMPPTDVVSEGDEKDGFWPPQPLDGSAYPVNAVKPFVEGQLGERKLILRVLPIIRREPIHHSFRLTEKELNDQGCVYSPGMALFSDAPLVLARLSELSRPHEHAASDQDSITPQNSQDPTTPQRCYAKSCTQESMLLSPASEQISEPLSAETQYQPRRPISPPSPLFPALGEIDSLNNRHQHPQSPQLSRSDTANSRRSMATASDARPRSASGSWQDAKVDSIKNSGERVVLRYGVSSESCDEVEGGRGMRVVEKERRGRVRSVPARRE